jgi:hypothetical protein
MTVEEAKVKYGDPDRNYYVNCYNCPLNQERFEHNCPPDCRGYDDAWEAIATLNDGVTHPSHYNREGGMEAIDEMVLIFGKEAVKNFCLCNVWKYRYRAADKNGEEDLKKSDWYMIKYKELCEMGDTNE